MLRAVNVPVPHRMSILGFDGHAMAEPWDLSTLAQPARRLGQAAAELAHGVIHDPEAYRDRHVVLPVELVPRAARAGADPRPGPGDGAGDGAGREWRCGNAGCDANRAWRAALRALRRPHARRVPRGPRRDRVG
ncbi:substrate-binding domain-containing protein [Streptomyces sp. M19]